MLIVSRGAIQGVASAITDALVSASTHRGHQHIMPTIDPQKLIDIALGALTMAAGDVVWPAGKVIEKHIEEQVSWLKINYGERRG